MKVRIRRRLLKQRRFRQLLISLILLSILLGMAIVPIESIHPESKFHTRFDGIYWAITTLTTVGYGDIVPVTIPGRLAAIVLQIMGAMIFGLVIATISSYVNRVQDEFYWGRLFERIDRLEEELQQLKKQNDYLVKDESKKADGKK